MDYFPKHGYDVFPSRDIPINFNFGSVFHYMIETMPNYKSSTDLDSDSSDSSDSSDEEEEQVIKIRDPFLDGESQEIRRSKKLRRGLLFVKSKFVTGVQDCLQGQLHYYKGHIRASMEKTAYWVHVALSHVSGSVIKCTCDCVQRALGRCSHVCALLLQILLHVRLNGYGGEFILPVHAFLSVLKFYNGPPLY